MTPALRPSPLLPTLMVLWLVLPARPALAGDWTDLPPFEATPEQLLAAAEAHPAGDDVVVLLEDVHYRWDADGRVEATLHQVYQVRSQGALEGWGLTEARWSPWYQDRPELRSRVITPDGQELWLDPASVAEAAVTQLDSTLFDDDRKLRAPLPGMTVGAVVEERIVHRDREPFFPGGGSNRLPVGEFVPLQLMRIHLEAPVGTDLRWRAEGIEPAVRKSRARGIQRVDLELRDLPPIEGIVEYLPPDHSPLPYVEFSTAASWDDVARLYHEQLAEIGDADAMAALVAEARAAGGDREQQVRAAMAAIRARIRYTGVEFGRQSIIPHPLERTLERGYGDCKDQALLLVRILAELGVDAELALLRAGLGPDVSEGMPGLELFNHAIVHVPGEPALWVDPTSPFTDVGELPLGAQGRKALLARADGPGLTPTPMAGPSDNLYREVRTFALPAEGNAAVTESTTATGWIGASLRHNYMDTDDAAVQQHLGQYADDMYAPRALSSWELGGVHDASEPFRILLELEGAATGYASGADASVLADPRVALGWLPEPVTLLPHEGGGPLTAREAPLAAPRHRAEVVYRVQVADGYRVRPLPPSRTQTFGPVELSESYEIADDGGVEVAFVLDTGDGVMQPGEAEGLRVAVTDLQRRSPIAIEFDQQGEIHLAHGRIADAIAAYDDLIEANPDVALYRSLRAAAMLPAGFGEAARAEARRAVEADPDSPSAWRYLGYVLMHDIYGRELRWPFDREGAIGALERTLELEPHDAVAAQNLAVVLEYDDRGQRYGAGADLERAGQLYRERRERLDARDLDLNLLFVLFHTGRHQELQVLAREMPANLGRDALLFASLAQSDGPEAVVVEANLQAMSGVTKQAEVEEAGRLLIQGRRYPEAAALLRASARNSANPVMLRQQADRVEQIRPFEEILAEATGPSAVVMQMLEVLFRPDADPEELRALFSRELREEADDEEAYQALTELGALLRKQGLSQEVVLDLGLSSLTFEVEGGDRRGYRVRAHDQDGQSMDPLFVIQERGEYRIRASWTEPSSVGDEALARALRGDTDGAHQWLTWAAEAMGPDPAGGPFVGSPFRSLWAGGDPEDRTHLRVCAAALAAPRYGDAAAPVLEAARKKSEDEGRTLQIDRALLSSRLAQEDHEAALEITERLVEAAPDDPRPRQSQVATLVKLERYDEALAVAHQLAASHPDDPRLVMLEASAAEAAGEADRAIEVIRGLAAGGQAAPWMLNQLAWFLLFVDGATDEALDFATRATTERQELNGAALHTLAVALAEQGRTHEAREVLVLALDQLDSADELPPVWWYVIGRMAEEYALPDVARNAYHRVPTADGPLETAVLAGRRLEILGEP